MSLKNGYDILNQSRPYDLIFLDPYNDFWNIWEDVTTKILKKQNNSSILLFLSHKANEESFFSLKSFLKKNKSTYLLDTLNEPLWEGGDKFFSVFFLPKFNLARDKIKQLEKTLKKQGEKIRGS